VHRMEKKEKRRLATAQKKESRQEVYRCTLCGNTLFDADKKFEAGCGFPSFWMHIGDHVKEKFLTTYGRERIQLLCNTCGQHLGHLFNNKRTPTRLRYCINADAIHLEESSK
jgi:peptide-methionine (R)-S-oxide reductase